MAQYTSTAKTTTNAATVPARAQTCICISRDARVLCLSCVRNMHQIDSFHFRVFSNERNALRAHDGTIRASTCLVTACCFQCPSCVLRRQRFQGFVGALSAAVVPGVEGLDGVVEGGFQRGRAQAQRPEKRRLIGRVIEAFGSIPVPGNAAWKNSQVRVSSSKSLRQLRVSGSTDFDSAWPGRRWPALAGWGVAAVHFKAAERTKPANGPVAGVCPRLAPVRFGVGHDDWQQWKMLVARCGMRADDKHRLSTQTIGIGPRQVLATKE